MRVFARHGPDLSDKPAGAVGIEPTHAGCGGPLVAMT